MGLRMSDVVQLIGRFSRGLAIVWLRFTAMKAMNHASPGGEIATGIIHKLAVTCNSEA